MKRSLALGVLFALLGLVVSVSAFAAPFNDASTAARDQYTVTTTATTQAPPPPASTVTTTTPAPPPGSGTSPSDDGDVNDNANDGGGVGDANDGGDSGNGPASPASGASGSRPAAARGFMRGRGGSAAAARACNPRDIALLSVGDFPPGIGTAFVAALGLPAWSGAMNSTNPFRFASGPGCGMKFTGLPDGFDADKPKDVSDLFGDAGEEISPAGGLAGGLPGLLDDFNGVIVPVKALVVSRSKISDSELRKKVEKHAEEIIAGAVESDIPVVAIEIKGTDPSSVDFFEGIDGVSFVNDVDTAQGKQSLQRLVAGAKPGTYGTGDDVDAKTPPQVSADRSAAAFEPADNGIGVVGVALLLAFVALSGRALFTVAQRRN